MGVLKLEGYDQFDTHVVDILGNTKGRDQPIMLMRKAIQMMNLLGKDILNSDEYVIFDPFAKGGEIILAASFARNMTKRHLVDVDAVKRDMFDEGRYYAMAPDQRHYRLSLRTFFGNEKSHAKKYQDIFRCGDYLSEKDGRLDLIKFKREFDSMLDFILGKNEGKKVVVVGNPPYQENYKGEGTNTGANSVYHLLLEHIMESQRIDQFLVVIPSRWFAAGRGKVIKEFASKLRTSGQVKQIFDFQDSKEVFPTVEIKGGVCFLHWDSKFSGKALFHSSDDLNPTYVDLSENSVIVRDKISRSIISKVSKKSKKYISDIAWSWNTFGLSSNYFKKNSESKSVDALECFTIRKVVKKIKPSLIKNADKVGLYKVVLPKAVKDGGIPYSKNQVFILNKKQICTETFIVVEGFKKKNEAERFVRYLQTDLVRFLLSVKKITHDVTKETWSLVPLMEMDKEWTDESLFKLFGLSDKEVEFIKSKVKVWG